jgi:hypothetical protein
MADDALNSALRGLVDSSGFPFQLAIENIVRSQNLGWKVLCSEVAWRNEVRGTHGFLDAVLEKNVTRLLLECKRTSKDAQWVFLQPKETSRARISWSATTRQRHGVGVSEVDCDPSSPGSVFCVVRGTGEDQRPMLERIGATLVDAAEALAHDQREMDGRELAQDSRALTRWSLFVSVLVTNARLFVCQFEANGVDVTTGRLPPETTFSPAPIVRFSKNLTVAGLQTFRGTDLWSRHKAGNRTVFVVNVEGLPQFLRSFEVRVLPHEMRETLGELHP